MERLIKMCTYRVVFGLTLTLIYRVMIWKYRKFGIYRVSNILGGQSVLDKYFKLELCLKMQNKKTAWLSFKVFFCWNHSSNCEKKKKRQPSHLLKLFFLRKDLKNGSPQKWKLLKSCSFISIISQTGFLVSQLTNNGGFSQESKKCGGFS